MQISQHVQIALCDDSKIERDIIHTLLSEYLDRHGYLANIEEFESGEELLAADVFRHELIILDIYMDELNGISTARELMKRNPGAKVIFCSTSNEFAAESYDVDALRYLTKPVSREKLFLTLDRYFGAYTAMKRLAFMHNRVEESMLLSDVQWIEADKHKCVIHSAHGDVVTTTTFSQFCDQLKDADFIKPIRYALVPLGMVAAVPANDLKLMDGTVIPISRELRQNIKDTYMAYKMKLLLKKGEM